MISGPYISVNAFRPLYLLKSDDIPSELIWSLSFVGRIPLPFFVRFKEGNPFNSSDLICLPCCV